MDGGVRGQPKAGVPEMGLSFLGPFKISFFPRGIFFRLGWVGGLAWGGRRNRAPGPHRNTARQAMDGLWTEVCGRQTQSNDPGNNQHNPQYANYWSPLTRKRHTMPHSAQPQHTNHWAPRTRKRHQQEHRPQRPTESSDPTQHAKGRTGDRPGPRKGATTRRNVTQGGPQDHPHPRGSAHPCLVLSATQQSTGLLSSMMTGNVP